MLPYSLIDLTVKAAPDIMSGLQSGTLVRYGSVIRQAAGSPVGGQIVAHLQESGMGPQVLGQMVTNVSPLGPLGSVASAAGQAANFQKLVQVQKVAESALKMSQIAAGASVLNLGVSAVGFAYTAYRLNQLQSSVDSMHRDLTSQLSGVSQRVDSMNHQLGYLRVMAEHNADLQAEILQGVRFLSRAAIMDPLADVVAVANQSRRLADVGDPATLRELDAATMRLAGLAASIRPALDPETMLNLDLAMQGWLAGAGMLATEFDRSGQPGEMLRLLQETEVALASLATAWVGSLIESPNPHIQTVYRFAAPVFAEAILPERVTRIARYQPTATDPERAAREARVELRLSTSPATPQWVSEQIAAAGFMDSLAEASDRIASRRLLAEECLELGTTPSDLAAELENRPAGLTLVLAA